MSWFWKCDRCGRTADSSLGWVQILVTKRMPGGPITDADLDLKHDLCSVCRDAYDVWLKEGQGSPR